MKLRKSKSRDQIMHDAIRGSVPDGKLGVTRIMLTEAARGEHHMEGCTSYGKGDVVERLMMPRGRDSYAQTVRSHEARHATYSKRWSDKVKKATRVSEKLFYAVNIIEDCYVEQKPLPCGLDRSSLRGYCRDHLAAAMRDTHDIRIHRRICDANPEDERNTPFTRNGRILTACRALTMIRHYGGYAESRRCCEAEMAIEFAIGSPTYGVLDRIIALSRKGDRKLLAMRLLAALLEDEDVEMPDDPFPPFVTEGTGKGVGMRIIDLNPKSAWTSHDKKVNIVAAPSGSIVRVNRYVAAIVSGDASGLFARRHRQNPSGTVLIDASGSMHATTENVKRLCKMIPDATVAYYSGDDISKGVLAIYAEKNKRYGGELPTETLLGGNSVDMEALQWLQKQPEPWTLISDLGFCGSSFGGEEIAHAIVDREVSLKRLSVIPTFKKAFEVFESRNASLKRKVSVPTLAQVKAGEYDMMPEEPPEE